jgi:cytochrome c biogenesis protein ResB
MFNIDLKEGTLNINKNYLNSEPIPLSEPTKLKIKNIPEDKLLIKISNQFLNKYKINMNSYGAPEVDNNWKTYYNQAQEPDKYIPQTITVVYPLIINGQSVYDESGNKTGPRLNINIKSMQVESLWGISSNNFESSLYDIEYETKKLINIAEQGGWKQYYHNNEPEGKKIEIGLGQPIIEYVKIYHYDTKDNTNNELLVPSLIFPVIDVPENEYFWQKYIIVPLIKDLLKEDQNKPILYRDKNIGEQTEEQMINNTKTQEDKEIIINTETLK